MNGINNSTGEPSSPGPSSDGLSLPEYQRYGRQMILPRFGLQGQSKLRQAKVLVVGAGGLGCPAVQYLAAAGVGHITIVDNDHVERSNLARQILHNEDRIGMNKALSIAKSAQKINPHIRLEAVEDLFTVQNAITLISQHDIVLDCTDNVLARYLISDAAVMCGVQVVSGAGQGLEGQLVVLHKDLNKNAHASGYSQRKSKSESKIARGPCYRCLFPKAPRPEDVTDCEDGGVLGGVTGLVGTMQAVEGIKLLVGMSEEEEPPNMTLVTPFDYPPFRTVKIRTQCVTSCRACGDPARMPPITKDAMLKPDLSGEDYIAFCGLDRLNRELDDLPQIDITELPEVLKKEALVIDVRPQVEYEIANLSPSTNYPFRFLSAKPSDSLTLVKEYHQHLGNGHNEVYIICRKGNDSQMAQRALSEVATAESSPLQFINVKGGLRAWSEKVDSNFPVY